MQTERDEAPGEYGEEPGQGTSVHGGRSGGLGADPKTAYQGQQAGGSPRGRGRGAPERGAGSEDKQDGEDLARTYGPHTPVENR